MKKILLTILLMPVICLAQEKPDSTMFRHYVKELKSVQKQIAQIDTVKVKLNGIAEYLYSKAIEEQKRFKKDQPKEK